MNEFERMRRRAEMVKKQFPQGTRIELVSMNDPYSPVPSGMRGTVDCVDDIGTIFPISALRLILSNSFMLLSSY